MSTARISQLPFRARLAVCLLYLAALGVVFTGFLVSWLRGFGLGAGLGLGLETLLVIDLIRRA